MKSVAKRESMIERPAYRVIRDYAARLGYKDIIYLNVGEPDFPSPPNVVEAAKKAMDEGFTHYTEERGLSELREILALKISGERGIEVDADGILITNGSAEGIFVTLMTIVDNDDEVVIVKPYYPPYLYCVRVSSGKPVFVSPEDETLTPSVESIKAAVTNKTKAIIVNSPCNPTGVVYGEEVLKTINDLAEDYGFYVLSDEVYDKFVYEGEHRSIASYDKTIEHTIIINSFSKTYAMTGWRIGYLACRSEITSKILKIKSAVNVCANAISQKAAIEALKNSDSYVKMMLTEYRKRREIVLEALSKLPKIRVPIPKGAFYVFPDISQIEKDSLKFTMWLLEKAHVVVGPGVAFGMDGYIRISYSNSIANLKNAMDRIASVL
ncbi:MAG: pyridoxal phosphate-dependent aminotransferase [Candidatus Bathyarchaeota archaeon]